jgi:type IV pilus assembly protein PilO
MDLKMDSILKLPPSKKAIILVVILVLITAGYYFRFYSPRQEELKAFRADLNKLIEELNKSRTIARDYQKFMDQVTKLDKELKNALTQLPNEKEIPEILKNITVLGKESNLEFTLFRPKPEEPQQFYAKVPIELILLGSYHNTGIFFDKVSKLPRIINVVDFNLTQLQSKDMKGKGSTEIIIKTSCLVNTYRFIEKKSEEKKSEKRKTPPKKEEKKL